MEIFCPYVSLSDRSLKGSSANDLSAEYDLLMQKEYYQEFNTLIGVYKRLLNAGDQKQVDEKIT